MLKNRITKSQTWIGTTSPLCSTSAWSRNVSYEIIRIWLWGLRPKVCINPLRSFWICSLVPPSIARGANLPGNHLCTSLYQFFTRLLGHTTIAFSIVALQSGLCLSRVHMRVMHCRVLPRPMQWARTAPPGTLPFLTSFFDSKTASHMNLMPLPWKKIREITSIGNSSFD